MNNEVGVKDDEISTSKIVPQNSLFVTTIVQIKINKLDAT